jgi:hypothetical protein
VIDGQAWVPKRTICAARVNPPADDSRTRGFETDDQQVRIALPRTHETTIGSWRLRYGREVAEITKRQQLLAESAGEVLAILLGLWMTFGLEWREFGPGLVLFGAVGFVVTCVRYQKSRTSAVVVD